MTNSKLTDERPGDEGLEFLITIRREIAERHASEGHAAQCAVHTLVLNALLELQERRKAEAPGYPETLPCPVFLEPGLKFGKGVSTRLVLDALRRRADYYAELEGMTPEQRAKHDAGIDEFKAMLQGSQPVSNRDELPVQ
ncbi:hypothetical protein FVJ47_05515 [Salmonella enterica subsp. enterica serovar Telelkebir]|nr:hypothetical protein [Salmonella enterica subsp. enterica serovar Telelkebir]